MQGFKFIKIDDFLAMPCSHLRTISQQVVYYQFNSDKLQKIILFQENPAPETISLSTRLFFIEFGLTYSISNEFMINYFFVLNKKAFCLKNFKKNLLICKS